MNWIYHQQTASLYRIWILFVLSLFCISNIFALHLCWMCICNVCVMCHEYRSCISGSERTSHHDSRPEVMESILGWGIFFVFLFVCFILNSCIFLNIASRERRLKDHETLFFVFLCTLWHSAQTFNFRPAE